MSCRREFLREDQLLLLHDAFHEAFADYQLDLSSLTSERLRCRLEKNAVDLESSVGVFDGDTMVGFTLFGIDDWRGTRSAFDAGTGIVPAHRGAGWARRMFDQAMPRLVQRGVRKVVLEVLQDNAPAIKAYEKAGFRKTRELDCYAVERTSLAATEPRGTAVAVRPINNDALQEFREFLGWEPSWENSFSSMARIPEDVARYGAFVGHECVGVLVYCAMLNWITCLLVKASHRRCGVATHLLTSFLENHTWEFPTVKLNNVDRSDQAMHEFLTQCGFTLYVGQFEMELEL